jgi:hypothetical protein
MASGIKFAGQLADAALFGESGMLTKILVKKIEGMGEDLINEFVSQPLGMGERVAQAVRTGGQSEFDRARDSFLHNFQPAPLPGAGLVRKAGAFIHALGGRGSRFKRRGRGVPGSWQASSWATSRDDWLDNHWHHDWRSQPRDTRGRWIPGRLDYIEAQLQYRGKSKRGRTVLRRRKRRRLRRLATKRELRKIMAKRPRDAY